MVKVIKVVAEHLTTHDASDIKADSSFIDDLGAIWPTTPSSLVRVFCLLSEYVLAYAFTLIVDSHALFNRCVAIGRT